jgi:hypothetical protein
MKMDSMEHMITKSFEMLKAKIKEGTMLLLSEFDYVFKVDCDVSGVDINVESGGIFHLDVE